MVTLSSTQAVLDALARSRTITLGAYMLRPGRIEDALLAAARRGAHVVVRIEGQPFGDPCGALLEANCRAVSALRKAGADAALTHEAGSGDAPLHAKAIVADGTLFLDDRNWVNTGTSTVLRDVSRHDAAMVVDALAGAMDAPTPAFAVSKYDALASEAGLLQSAASGDDVIVESESFGAYNPAYYALDHIAKQGLSPRLLVTARELQASTKERAALSRLALDGVRIRTTGADEKCSLVGNQAWVGSANASAAFERPDTIDWGVVTDNAQIVNRERRVFESRWQSATPLIPNA